MWFSSVYLRTLRGCWIAILGWGLGMGLVVLQPLAGAGSVMGTAAGRRSLAEIATSMSWNAAPVAVDTAAGYAVFKVGIFMLLLALWPLLAGSRTLRGEEERGSLDVLLSMPHSRVRLAVEKLAAIGTALLAIGAVIALVVFAGSRPFDPGFGLGDAVLFGLDLVLVCGVFGSLALLISQFTLERRRAAGWTGAVLLVAIALDMVHRLVPGPGAEWVSRLSPVYYYNLSKPLIPSYGTNAGAMLLLAALCALIGAVAVWLFARRDAGGTVLRQRERAPRREAALPVRDWSLRSVYLRSLGAAAVPVLCWTAGMAVFAAGMVAAVKQIEGAMAGISSTSNFMSSVIQNVGGGDVRTNATLLSAIFVLLPVLLMAFSVTQVNGWSSDEEEGRLDLVLSTPRSRTRVLLGRFAALGTATVAIGVATLVASAATAAAVGLRLDGGRLAAATLGIIPLGLLVAAIGYLAAGWLRTAADTGLISLLLAAWFLISFIGPELRWPDAVLHLSALYYYGTPLLHGLQLTSVLGLLAAIAAALALGSWRFAAKDIG